MNEINMPAAPVTSTMRGSSSTSKKLHMYLTIFHDKYRQPNTTTIVSTKANSSIIFLHKQTDPKLQFSPN